MARLHRPVEHKNEFWFCPVCGEPNAIHVTKTYNEEVFDDGINVMVTVRTNPDIRHLKCAFCGWERDWGLFNGDMDNGDHLHHSDCADRDSGEE